MKGASDTDSANSSETAIAAPNNNENLAAVSEETRKWEFPPSFFIVGAGCMGW